MKHNDENVTAQDAEDVIDVDAEVINEEQEQNNLSTPDEKAAFPLQINPEELTKMFGNDDPGKFAEAIAESGLIVGRVVSLMMSGNKRKFERAKVSALDPDSITMKYMDGSEKKFGFGDVKQIEVLHKGQRFAAHELRYPMYGLSEETVKPHLKLLTTGEETHIKGNREDGTELNAKLRLYRSTEEKSKGLAAMYAVFGADKLEIKDIPKLGIVFTDEMKKELLETGVLAKPVVVTIINPETQKEEEKRTYKITIDKELNVVRLQRVHQKKQSIGVKNPIEMSKKDLVEIVKHLKSNGYSTAWANLDTPETLKSGIELNKAAGASASIVFSEKDGKHIPHLKIDWKLPETQGIGKKAYTETFKGALEKVNEFLAGEKVGEGKKAGESLKVDQEQKEAPKKSEKFEQKNRVG